MTNYNFKNLFLFIIIFSGLTFAYLNFSSYTSAYDSKIREYFFKIRGEIPTSNNIVIVDIDEKSIKALGQWPFSRDYMAQVLVNLTNAKAGIIGMDIIFSEEDRNSPSNIAKLLGLKGDFQNNDLLLGEVVATTPTILGYFFTDEQLYKNSSAPHIPSSYTISPHSISSTVSSSGVVTNVPDIQNRAYSSGFFNAYSSGHGKITKMPLIMSYKNKIYPSLALEMVRAASQTYEVKIVEDKFGIEGLQLNEFFIPTDTNGFLDINFRGAKKSFKYISFIDVLNGDFNASDVYGKFILIGTSLNTLADLRAMVYDLAIPGVEIHANIIDNILKGDFLYTHTSAVAIDTITIFCLTIILALILLALNSSGVVFVFLLVTSGLYTLYYYILFNNGLIVNLFYPLVAIVITSFFALLINYSKEKQIKESIKNKFAKKVSLEVVNDLLNQKSDKFKAQTKEVTIFFSDLRDFTSLSEKIKDPQKVVELLNLYMEPMVEEIIKRDGTIDKFIGDAIMAYWNAPKKVKDHQKLAVETALKQIEKLKILNQQIKSEYGIVLDIGIAIHCGEVTVGEIGSTGRSDYTIIGDNVNLTSRLEALTKILGSKLIISEDMKNRLEGEFILRKLANICVKGKTKSILLYEVICHKDNKPKDFDELNNKYEEAIQLYENQEFEKAIHAFELVDFNYHHNINQLYINEAQKYLKNPNLEFSLKFTITDK